jgi:hypothetical protein
MARVQAAVELDFTVQDEGTIKILYPQTEAAEQWITDHIANDAQRWAGGVVVEHRFIEDILFGVHNDGLTFEVR